MRVPREAIHILLTRHFLRRNLLLSPRASRLLRGNAALIRHRLSWLNATHIVKTRRWSNNRHQGAFRMRQPLFALSIAAYDFCCRSHCRRQSLPRCPSTSNRARPWSVPSSRWRISSAATGRPIVLSARGLCPPRNDASCRRSLRAAPRVKLSAACDT